MSTYLYGIVPDPVPQDAHPDTPGVGDPPRPVRILRHRRALAALVSDVTLDEVSGDNVRLLRRNMKAHAAILNALVARTTVLPVRFGVVFPDDRSLIAKLLDPQQAVLQQYLAELQGTVEITLKATYLEDRVLAQIVSEQPQLVAQGRGASRASYQSKLETGKRIAAAIQDRRDKEGQWIVDKLRKTVLGIRINKTLSDLMALNASFLVDRGNMPAFDKEVERIHAQVGEYIKLDCVGPLPPYSFVDLRL
jgi:hypothetical protein